MLRRLFPEKRPAKAAERKVIGVLGPTNTGKTHFAIERMLSHPSGMIGLPLRLLAREVYNRVVERAGIGSVALVTGEEKIKPKSPRYWVSTLEAMPRDIDTAFVAIDEIQIAADLDRGHVFTDRILNCRGLEETLLIGASTMTKALQTLIPGIPIVTRPRLSKLTYAGARKISRLPRRSAIVAFSAEDVYAIAEWIRRQKGGAAVVLGALSPRTRNAQIALYQNGDVDYIVATDAIGMGLNLDVDHIAFASDRKFDGWQFRRLKPAEFGQIAGRAGRHMSDGTFGSSGRCPPFDEELIEAIEDHRFDQVSMLQWRNTDLDFASIGSLQSSLDALPDAAGLTRAPVAEDQLVLDIAARDAVVLRQIRTPADVARLWDACQIPDYRKVSPAAHAELALTIFRFVVRRGQIPEDWLARQISLVDRTDGDLDVLSGRIAQIRTWTYIANRSEWLANPEHWQTLARRVEDSLSDALHDRLAQRFVDRRTSLLIRRLRENSMLDAEITATGDVLVEGQHVGNLNGFRFAPDPQAAGEEAKTLTAAAQKAVVQEIENRAVRVVDAVDDAFVLAHDGSIRWLGEPIGKLASGDKILVPRVHVLSDTQLSGAALEGVQRRLELWLTQHLKKLLGPLFTLETGEGLEGAARGIAFQLAEELGILERGRVASEIKALSQDSRGLLRRLGVRFGAYHVFLPLLVKPAARALAAQLWSLKHGGPEAARGLDEVAHFASSGRTSFAADVAIAKPLYRAAGFRVCGERAVRVDILERLADLIRPAIAYKPGVTAGDPPPGTADGSGFAVTVGMTSLAGCSGESFASILRSLGFASEKRAGPAITVPLVPKAPTVPLASPDSGSGPEVVQAELPAEQVESVASEEGNAEMVRLAANTARSGLSEDQALAQPDVGSRIEPETSGEVGSVEAVSAIVPTEAGLTSTEVATAAQEPAANGEPEPEPLGDETGTGPDLIEIWHPHRPQVHARNHDRRTQPPKVVYTASSALRKTRPPERASSDGAERVQENGAERVREKTDGSHHQRDKFHHRDRPKKVEGRNPKPVREMSRKPERKPDPDSPFAKLLELKAELEKKTRT